MLALAGIRRAAVVRNIIRRMSGSGKTSLCARLIKNEEPLVFERIPVPNLKKNEVLIKMEMVGVCHSDIHMRHGYAQGIGKIPITLGHEGVGHIVEVGDEVTKVKIGDRVCTSLLKESCQHCEYCLSGWENICDARTNFGVTADGTFSEYLINSAHFCNKVPESLTLAQAVPITCAGVTTYKALKESNVKAGQWVVIVGGAGGLGNVAIQYAKFMGIRVIGIDCGDEKLDFMKKLGCDSVLDGKKQGEIIEAVQKITNGGAHAAIILAPLATCIQEAIEYLRKRGTIVVLSFIQGDFTVSNTLLIMKAITIKGSIVGSRQDLDEALDLAAHGNIKSKVEICDFRDVNQAFEKLNTGKVLGRIVLDFSKI